VLVRAGMRSGAHRPDEPVAGFHWHHKRSADRVLGGVINEYYRPRRSLINPRSAQNVASFERTA